MNSAIVEAISLFVENKKYKLMNWLRPCFAMERVECVLNVLVITTTMGMDLN